MHQMQAHGNVEVVGISAGSRRFRGQHVVEVHESLLVGVVMHAEGLVHERLLAVVVIRNFLQHMVTKWRVSVEKVRVTVKIVIRLFFVPLFFGMCFQRLAFRRFFAFWLLGAF